MSADPPVHGDFVIVSDWRRWRLYPAWLPFGTLRMTFAKKTTWREVEHFATHIAEQGSGLRSVTVTWSEETT